jgi:hypothetical protein
MTRRRRIVVGVGLAALALVGLWHGWRAYSNWRVERLIARFATAPDQATADTLCELLDNQRVSQEVGNRILEMLTKPKVEVRDPHPAGEKRLWVAHTLPCDLALRKLLLDRKVTVPPAEREYWSGGGDGRRPWDFDIDIGGSADGRHCLDTPGTYWVTEQWRIALIQTPAYSLHERVRGWGFWARSGFRWRPIFINSTYNPVATYACRFDVTLMAEVAPVSECERIQLRTDATLDGTMRKAFTFLHDERLTGSEDRWVRWSIDISGAPFMPENVAFRGAFRPDGGGPTLDLGPLFAWRRGSPHELQFASMFADLTFDPLPVGKHQGTLILAPDPVVALRLAGVKEIWGGTLEFPVELTIEEKAIPGKAGIPQDGGP